jgi:hypothetical protein
MKFWATDQRYFSFATASRRFIQLHRRAKSGKSASGNEEILVFFIRPPRLRIIVDAVALTESSTLGNTLMRFASPLLMKRWFRRNG